MKKLLKNWLEDQVFYKKHLKKLSKYKIKLQSLNEFFFDLLRNRLKSEVGKLEIGSHQNTLKRGYTYIKDLKNNLFIKSAKNIKENANLKISFYDGNIKAIAKKK